MTEFSGKEIKPQAPCPVCKATLHTLKPSRKRLLEYDDHKPDAVTCLTFCTHCGTMLEYNLRTDECIVMRQELIDQLRGKPEYEMMQFLSFLRSFNGKTM